MTESKPQVHYLISPLRLFDFISKVFISASQFWCLLRKLPFLVGDRIPEDDPHYQLLLLLIEVVDYIMAPLITKQSICYLEGNVNLLFSEFKLLFPNLRITPKCHYVLHYPRLMIQVGLLIRHWVMRYEAKHHFFKRTAVITGNYTNVAKTLAIRHQILQSMLLYNNNVINPNVIVQEGFQLDLNSLPMGASVIKLLHGSTATSCQSLLVFSTKYSVGDSVLFGFEDDESVQIGKILHIFLNSTKSVCFVLSVYEVMEYCEHFHSWKIRMNEDANLKPVLYDELPDHQIIGVHKLFSSDDDFEYANFRYHCCPVDGVLSDSSVQV